MAADLSASLVALLDLMTDPELRIAQRIEAAKAVIEHEAPPAVFELAQQFLLGVAEGDYDAEWKLKALALVRKVEARRVVPGTTTGPDDFAVRALGKSLGVAEKRLQLIREGNWPPAPGWHEDIAPVRVNVIAVEGLADSLKAARLGRVAKNSEDARPANA